MGWYNSSWPYRLAVTIDHTKVAGDETDFPILLSLTDSDLADLTNGGYVGKSDGTDILFTEDDGETKLSHEIQRYTNTTGEVIIWIKVPALDSAVDTVIYLYCGNDGAADQQDASGVWSDYEAVFHTEAASGDLTDATGNGNTARDSGTPAYQQIGKIGYSIEFDASGDYFELDNETNFDFERDDSLTWQVWAKIDSISATSPALSKETTSGQPGIRMGCFSDARFFAALSHVWGSGGNWLMRPTVATFDDSAFHLLFWTYDGSETKAGFHLYPDGSEGAYDTDYNTLGANTIQCNNGVRVSKSSKTGTILWWDGWIEEIRISKTDRTENWATTEYNNQDDPGSFHTLGSVETNWYDTRWRHRKKITIDHTEVAGDETDFPVLVSVTDADLKSSTNGGGVGLTDGTDILFTSQDGTTKLSHEIQRFTPGTGELIAWVKVPSLDSSADTEIYIYYGFWNASDQQNASDLWSDYEAVFHMNEASGDLEDVTGNGNTAADYGNPTYQQSGKIGYCVEFDGDADEFRLANESNFDFNYNDSFTVQAWGKTPTMSSAQTLVAKAGSPDADPGWRLGAATNGAVTGLANTWAAGGPWVFKRSTPTYDDDQFHMYVVQHDGTATLAGFNLYMDGGTPAYAYTEDTLSTQSCLNNAPVRIGSRGADDGDATVEWVGEIDEVRIATIELGSNWTETEYNNQDDPSSFMSFGSEENVDFWTIKTFKALLGVRG